MHNGPDALRIPVMGFILYAHNILYFPQFSHWLHCFLSASSPRLSAFCQGCLNFFVHNKIPSMLTGMSALFYTFLCAEISQTTSGFLGIYKYFLFPEQNFLLVVWCILLCVEFVNFLSLCIARFLLCAQIPYCMFPRRCIWRTDAGSLAEMLIDQADL